MINEHLTEFAGRPVVRFQPKGPVPSVPDPSAVAWRVDADYFDEEDVFAERFAGFLRAVDPAAVTALIVGQWGSAHEDGPPVDLLVEAAPRLPNLEALFLGEMVSEECEISWIIQGDVTPLLRAWPGLATLQVRGGTGLVLEPVRHETLRTLGFESGGLSDDVVRAVAACDLPALTHLELWLGTGDYGATYHPDDLAPILAGDRLPALRHLGLRNAELADRVAAAVAAAPVVKRLEVLDLSMGVLSDAGAQALLDGQPLTHLRRLVLAHHYLSEAMAARLVETLPGVAVDVSDRQEEEDDYRYVAVGE